MSFWPNTATCGCTMLNSLATTVRTPSKWPGRAAPSQRAASAPRTHDDTRRLRIDLRTIGNKQYVDAARLRLRRITLEVARIPREILRRPKLQRIDENAHHDEVRAMPRFVHEPKVALVQIAHRRHEAHTLPARAGVGDNLAHLRDTGNAPHVRSCADHPDTRPHAPHRGRRTPPCARRRPDSRTA